MAKGNRIRYEEDMASNSEHPVEFDDAAVSFRPGTRYLVTRRVCERAHITCTAPSEGGGLKE